MSEKVVIGFTSPGSITVEVDDPADVDEIAEAFVERAEKLRRAGELHARMEDDPEWLVENLIYVDSTDGEVYHEW